jgi:beta-1,4-mannosyltransferase
MMKRSQRSVLMIPARRNRLQQPYNYILTGELERLGWRVLEARSLRLFLPWTIDVLHLHWPEYLFRGRSRFVKGISFSIYAIFLRCLGARIVQTVHNSEPHDGFATRYERLGVYVLDSVTVAVVAHSRAVLSRAELCRPALKPQTSAVIPVPAYPFAPSPGARELVRSQLRVEAADALFIHFGLLDRRKGTLELIQSWERMEAGPQHLHVVGKPIDDGYARELRNAAISSKVSVDLRFVPEEELADLLAAADVCVMGRLSSSSATIALALSAECPVMVPSGADATELVDTFGSDWIWAYEAPISSVAVRNAMSALPGRVVGISAHLPTFTDVAAATAEMY